MERCPEFISGGIVLANRIFWFDRLRIIATLAVIVIHIAGSELFVHSIGSPEWDFYNMLDSLSRFAVPVFIMMSGALFLNPEKRLSIKVLYSKNLLRIICAFAAWSLFYAIVKFNGDINAFIRSLFLGHHHMYFLYLIAGLYMAVPILRKICEDEQIMRYFLVLALAFTFVLPAVSKLPHMSVVAGIEQKISFHIAVGYSAYFVGGYYLSRVDVPKKGRSAIYILGIMAFLVTAVVTRVCSIQSQKLYNGFYNGFSINVLVESISLFVFAKYNMSKSPKSDRRARIISELSKITFGIYLAHMFVIDVVDSLGILDSVSSSIVYAGAKITLVFIVSAIISYIINKIPVLNKYIV